MPKQIITAGNKVGLKEGLQKLAGPVKLTEPVTPKISASPLPVAPIPRLDERLLFEADTHTYFFDGEEVPSVSTILGAMVPKPALINWAKKQAIESILSDIIANDGAITLDNWPEISKKAMARADYVKDEAADTGSQMHTYIEARIKSALLKGEATSEVVKNHILLVPPAERIKKPVDAFVSWLDAHAVTFLASEVRVIDPLPFYAGTFDAYARVDGDLSIIDWKSSTGLWNEYALQLAGYQNAARVCRGIIAPRLIAARFDKKTAEFEAKDVVAPKAEFEEFLRHLTNYKRRNEKKFKVNGGIK